MNRKDNTKAMLTKHFNNHPKLKIQDIFKYVHQSTFGCEHAVSSCDEAIQRIRDEYSQNVGSEHKSPEPLDGAYSRVHLSYMNQGLSAETLGKLFYFSASKEQGTIDDLKEKLNIARELISQGIFPFTIDEFNAQCYQWEQNNFRALHHSDSFRKSYSPAYRVISNTYMPFLPLFSEIDTLLKKGSVKLAIEGGSASGKTTLSAILEQVYDCTVLHMDDFFLQSHQRTTERLLKPGGNIDIERFVREVLIPLKQNKDIQYRKFDCQTMQIKPAETISPKKLTIVEGAYSMHPQTAGSYNLSVFLDIDSQLQKERITKRNTPQMAERFFSQWIPMENLYFKTFDIKNHCNITIKIIL